MNLKERFHAIMGYEDFDRIPVWFFGTWPETKIRWEKEGWSSAGTKYGNGSGGPQLDFMDADWETSFEGEGSIWNNQGLVRPQPIGGIPSEIIEENAEFRTVRKSTGGIVKISKTSSSISQSLKHDLQPDREDWNRFKNYLDPDDPRRILPRFEERVAALSDRERMTCFLGGSLFGWMNDWMGLEAVSYLPYDDLVLYEEIISFMADYFMEVNARFLDKVNFDFSYFFEDCCFNSGPMISPDIYRRFYDKHYRRMIDFYRSKGIKWMLVDSDGKIDDLLPCWLESGFDIVFPIEVGVWRADPLKFRKKYGRSLRMLGGVDKHVIAKGESAVRRELTRLKPLVEDGGFIPLPDHRIPPDVSLEQMKIYVEIFQETFNS